MLKNIDDPSDLGDALFGFAIRYNDITDPLKRLYNGNISQTLWNSQSPVTGTNPISSQYTYTYDALNRITSATDNTTNYDLELVEYDRNGNIQKLKRKGHTQVDGNGLVTAFGIMDDLVYAYDSGNRLLGVSDGENAVHGFVDGNTIGNDYGYDSNGNMTSDANKGITDIQYNHLNLPVEITVEGNGNVGNIVYIYDATGTKLRKIVTNTGESSLMTTDYAGNYIYGNNSLQFFGHPEGYVNPDGNGGYDYVYQYRDHLGNVRLSYSDLNNDGDIDVTSNPMTTEILEENNYYPFGLRHKGYNNTIVGTENNYQTYQGKEEEKELGTNTYAFGWRDYDAAIGRFNKVDRFAEKYYSKSPYGFSANNPIRLIEVQGDSLWISFGKNNENKVLYQDGNLLNSDGTAYTGDGVKVKKDGSVKIKNSFLKKTVKALNAIGGTDTGGDMLADLQGSDFNFTVNDAKFNPKDAGYNMFVADNTVNAHFWEGMATRQGYFTNIGSGGNIYWNASDPAYGTLTEVGDNRRFRPTTNLAHELVHGWDANTGNLDGRPGTPGGLSRKEYRASYYENQIRGQLGTPLRSIYRYQGNNYNLLNYNQPIFYSKPSIELMIAN